jgi:hypothetical protein
MRMVCLATAFALAGCVVDDLDTSETDDAVLTTNRLAANRLAANRLAANRLAANSLSAAALTAGSLIETADGREVFSYIVSCALPAGTSVTVKDSLNNSYTFPGEIGLAPGWQTATPSVADRHWVTACLLARTNYYGVTVQLSMRGSHPALATTSTETNTYKVAEGAFYGDLFATTQSWYACGSKKWTSTLAQDAQRTCAISQDGVTTMCGFTYEFFCGNTYSQTNGISKPAACSNAKAPWSGCKGAELTTWSEVITIFLKS